MSLPRSIPPVRRPASGPVVLVTRVGTATGSRAAAAALAGAFSDPDRAGLLVDLDSARALRPTLLATAGARALEERLAAHLPEAGVASRGGTCHLSLPPDSDGLDSIVAALPLVRDSLAAIHVPPCLLQAALGEPRIRPTAALLRADLDTDRSLTALAARELIERDIRVAVLKHPLGWLAARAALLGVLPSSPQALPFRLVERLLQEDRGDAEDEWYGRQQDAQAESPRAEKQA